MPSYLEEGDVPQATDLPGRSLQKINNLLLSLLPAAIQSTVLAFLYPKKSTIWVPARAMTSRTTSGAAAGTAELTNNKVMLATLDFDKDADEFAQFTVALPKSWNEGTVTARIAWTAAAGAQDETVTWALQGAGVVDDENLDIAFGTAVTVADTFPGDNNYLRWTSETGAITLNGTVSDPAVAIFQIYRDISADNLAGDAKLIGVKLFYTEDTYTDA